MLPFRKKKPKKPCAECHDQAMEEVAKLRENLRGLDQSQIKEAMLRLAPVLGDVDLPV